LRNRSKSEKQGRFIEGLRSGTDTNAYFGMVVSYWEMCRRLSFRRVEQDLFIKAARLLFCWERLRDFVPAYREMQKSSTEWKNLETVANDFIQKWNAQSPGGLRSFFRRVPAEP